MAPTVAFPEAPPGCILVLREGTDKFKALEQSRHNLKQGNKDGDVGVIKGCRRT